MLSTGKLKSVYVFYLLNCFVRLCFIAGDDGIVGKTQRDFLSPLT
jgi:hypothetical protein